MNSDNLSSDSEVSENDLDIFSMLVSDDEEKWRNTKGQLELINQFIHKGERPNDILRNHFKMNVTNLPEDPMEQWSIIFHLIIDGPHRKRLENINTFQQACDLIKTKNNIMVLTGAGISVPCGVPDFRSRNGIYARLAVDFPGLDEPQSMFDINYFCKNPRPFFKFAKEIYPGKFAPSDGHKFIKLLESKNKLLRNYTQNIDTLEQVAGIQKIIQCHGSFATATCMRCEHKMNGSEIEDDVMNQRIPICPKCTNEDERTFEMLIKERDSGLEEDVTNYKLPIMKPDVVFFGEGLPKDFHATLADDKNSADLLIVIGSSLKVRPVAHVPGCLSPSVPQILINKEPLSNHSFDVELLGDCDVIVNELCRQLDWPDLAKYSTAKYIEKSIWEMKPTIAPVGLADKNSCDDDLLIEDTNPTVQRLVSVSNLLSDDLTCIRVPPNRYIFQEGDYTVNIADVVSADSQVLNIVNRLPHHNATSSALSSSKSDDENDRSDHHPVIITDTSNDDCVATDPKRQRRLSHIDL